MGAITQAIYDELAGDSALAALLNSYEGAIAVFTTDPAPGDATLPYIVTAGESVNVARDTKTTRGRMVWRDVRCYAPATGSAAVVEAIADRVRDLFHRQEITVSGFSWVYGSCAGPIVADELEAYCRVVTVQLNMEET